MQYTALSEPSVSPARALGTEASFAVMPRVAAGAASRPVRVLGLSFFFHDSAAALVSDGQIVAAAAEERFCRRKHTNEFPKQAIEYCLDAAGLASVADLDAVVFYEKPILKLDRLIETLVEVWPRGLGVFSRGLPQFLTSKFNVYSVIQKALPAYTGPILFAEHHLSHAASAFYCSPFDEAAILTIDGVGEWETTAIGVGRGRDIRLERAIRFPHSVGLLYSALTSYLGFQVNDGEWKVMGLAPYGRPVYVDQFRKLVDIKPDGSFTLDMDYFSYHYSADWAAHHGRWEALFGFPRRQPRAEIEQRHEDLARSGQAVVEDLILALAREARRTSGSENLVIAGGVGLNSVANWKIEREGIFRNVWIQPAAGDDGGALGAALLASRVVFDTPRCAELTSACLGPQYSDDEALTALEHAGLPFEHLADGDLVERVAALIEAGRVVGWCRGRMEFGPRALGSRSILADATNPGMKAIINQKIKYREYFRPFAPAVPLDHVHEYFEVPAGTALPFMLKVPRVRPEAAPRIPAVTHEDGTGRVQTVTRDDNPLYHALLKAVERRTGVPIVVNTSFNVRGEPIVCTPRDAVDCFLQTGIDALVVGNYLVTGKNGAELDERAGYQRSDALEARIEAVAGARGLSLAGVAAPSNIPVTGQPRAPRALVDLPELLRPRAGACFENAIDLSLALRRRNPVKPFRPAHALFSARPGLDVIDAPCGAGWFAGSCAHRYNARVTALDTDAAACRRARSTARLLACGEQVRVVETNLLEFRPEAPVDVVNLQDFRDPCGLEDAVAHAAQWLRPAGYLQLTVPHLAVLAPFLDHVRALRARGLQEPAIRAEFYRLNPDIVHDLDRETWYGDQLTWLEESALDHAGVEQLVRSAGFTILATSLNGFRGPTPAAKAARIERRLRRTALKALGRGHYTPGYLVVWAQRQ